MNRQRKGTRNEHRSKNINDVVIGNRTRKEMGDIKALAASIKHLGLLHPIVIDAENHLIAGQRRLAACKSLGWDQVPVHVVPLDNTLRGEFDENTVREDFTPSEQYAIRKALEERGPPVLERSARLLALTQRRP